MQRKVRDISATEGAKAIRETLAAVDPMIEPEAFLQRIEEESSILLEREAKTYAFAHLTLQEYLAAEHIRELIAN